MFVHRKRRTSTSGLIWWNHLVGTGLESDLLFRVFFGGLGGCSPCLALLWISRRFSRWNLLSHWSHLNKACVKDDSTWLPTFPRLLKKVLDGALIKFFTKGFLLFSWNCEFSSFDPDEASPVSQISDSALILSFRCSPFDAATFICFSSVPFSILFVCFGCPCSASFAFSSHNWRLSPSLRKESSWAAWRFFGFQNLKKMRMMSSPAGWPSPGSSTPPTSSPPAESGLAHASNKDPSPETHVNFNFNFFDLKPKCYSR